MQFNNTIQVKETSSTNDYLKKLAISEDAIEGTVILAEFQQSGRGMGKNVWESEKGKNLTFSLLLRPTFLPAELMFLISKTISLGIISYLNELETGFSIKWPNDIYYNNKKIGGILIENQLFGNALNYSLVGIGLNINQKKFYSEAPNPLSLATILGKTLDLQDCLNKILNNISVWYSLLQKGQLAKINSAYFSQLFRRDNYHNYLAEKMPFKAKICSVENDGQLILCTLDNQTKSFYFKEVEFVL